MPASPSIRHHRLTLLEKAAFCHLGLFFVATTWAFGGNALWLRPSLTEFGSLSILITLSAILGGENRTQANVRALHWLWPFVLFNLIALVSLHTPGLQPMQSGPDTLLVPLNLPRWKPVAAVPSDAWPDLALFDTLYLSCFNLALVARQRRGLRGLLLFVMANALALAVFGTLQQLVHAPGLYFGLFPTRQVFFFSTFIYHNHWGAFAVLMAALCLGLVWRYGTRAGERGFFHTPAFGGLTAVLFLAATAPLSSSRSCTLLMGLLLGGAFLHWIRKLVRQRRRRQASVAGALTAAVAAVVLALAGIGFLAKETITARVALTEQQVAVMREQGSIGGRMTLYRDTWHMALDRPWFGWGLASFPHMFIIYNTQEPNPQDHLPIFYSEAHSDWLQSLAENGVIGTALLGLCGLVPLFGLRRARIRTPLVAYLLAGCGLILLYAWIEFPFGNVAVVLTWWLCFFSAIRYAELQNEPERTD